MVESLEELCAEYHIFRIIEHTNLVLQSTEVDAAAETKVNEQKAKAETKVNDAANKAADKVNDAANKANSAIGNAANKLLGK